MLLSYCNRALFDPNSGKPSSPPSSSYGQRVPSHIPSSLAHSSFVKRARHTAGDLWSSTHTHMKNIYQRKGCLSHTFIRTQRPHNHTHYYYHLTITHIHHLRQKLRFILDAFRRTNVGHHTSNKQDAMLDSDAFQICGIWCGSNETCFGSSVVQCRFVTLCPRRVLCVYIVSVAIQTVRRSSLRIAFRHASYIGLRFGGRCRRRRRRRVATACLATTYIGSMFMV